MPMHKVRESDIPDLGVSYGMSTVVNVDVLGTNGPTSTIRVEDCGVRARQGEVYEVPTTAVHMWFDDL
ncbi:hypothetical protein [Paractinoplanes maris]|uniref:hypothetical protein n=1 Tax=Paractinoplanes maris TaxID=1734446 RepID=UPI0020228804|nr:hypothetical protein [Actinoplanes maris]